MNIEIDPITAIEIRVALYVNAKRWFDSAAKYNGERDKITDLLNAKAEHAFDLMNEFRDACGVERYTLEYVKDDVR